MWRVQVAMVSPQKMAGPAVITQGTIDRLIAGKNADYESSVLDRAKKNLH